MLLVFCNEDYKTCALFTLRGSLSIDEVALCRPGDLDRCIRNLKSLGEITYICSNIPSPLITKLAESFNFKVISLKDLMKHIDVSQWLKLAERLLEEINVLIKELKEARRN